MIKIIKRASELFLYSFAIFLIIMIFLVLTNIINFQINWYFLIIIWLIIYLGLIGYCIYISKKKN
ncbi:hypothetical protein GSH19_04625 [Lactobacillus sp. S2-2]|uniref:hypothetical protein n=1 Tax=Lactobacillus sp. S2-2 TaxID=2692917 RepID=UPI001F34CC24|nr:hypothetical protein [Lactobacillus sp. S2-2]MCF6515436.1 hypothetical protein [Lactobacillus sp. S2-2]